MRHGLADLVEGFLRLMASGSDLTGPVNIGNPGEFTMLQLAEQVLEVTGSKSRIVHKALPQDDPKQRRPDITLAREKLNWVPTVPLRSGLEKTAAYFEKLLSNAQIQNVIQS